MALVVCLLNTPVKSLNVCVMCVFAITVIGKFMIVAFQRFSVSSLKEMLFI